MLYEPLLRGHMTTLANAYCKATGLAIGTVARRLCGDNRFFRRLNEERRTFTALQYDRVVAVFASEWPADTAWPEKVPRPTSREIEEVMGRPVKRTEEHMSWQGKRKQSPKAGSKKKTSKNSSKKPRAKKPARKSTPAPQATSSATASTD